jgi:hypothetical protein
VSGTDVEPPGKPVTASLAPAFYAARGGGWHDYWTLLHPPYTAWHLSYVLLGAALSPAPDPQIVAGALVAFGLAVGVGAHAFDELNGRPLRTGIPSPVLVALGTASLLVAVALGLVAATMLGPLFLLFVIGGAAIVVLYAFEVPLVHSDLGFALGRGSIPGRDDRLCDGRASSANGARRACRDASEPGAAAALHTRALDPPPCRKRERRNRVRGRLARGDRRKRADWRAGRGAVHPVARGVRGRPRGAIRSLALMLGCRCSA